MPHQCGTSDTFSPGPGKHSRRYRHQASDVRSTCMLHHHHNLYACTARICNGSAANTMLPSRCASAAGCCWLLLPCTRPNHAAEHTIKPYLQPSLAATSTQSQQITALASTHCLPAMPDARRDAHTCSTCRHVHMCDCSLTACPMLCY